MSDFVDECRQEWKRLGVVDAVANEMAADLTADLQEAEGEGVSAEEVLGSAVFDPKSFAALWASERGVVPEVAASAGSVLTEERPRRTPVLAVAAALVVVAIAGAALVARASRSVGLVGSVRRVMPAPFVGPPARFKFPLFAPHDTGSNFAHGVGVLLLLVAVVGVIAGTIYWSRRTRPN